MSNGNPGGAGPTSVRSPRVSAVRKLQQRSEREARRLFVAEGPQAVREAAGAVRELYATADAAPQWPGSVVVPDEVLRAMAETSNPQGVLAVCRFVDVPIEALGVPRLAALLWQINDPGNAGTVLRTADAAGADAVLFSAGSVDVYNGKCVRSTAGSLFHVTVVRDADPVAAIDALRAAGCAVLAAEGGGAATLYELLPREAGGEGVLSGPVAWVFGNEARGLDPAISSAADITVSIPHAGRAESLNLAAAASLCLMTTAAAQAGRVLRGR